jgi:hypothetical protein
MQILATISDTKRVAILLDLKTGRMDSIPVRAEFHDSSVDEGPSFRPFGITWERDRIYVVNNRQLLVFDKSLNYLETLAIRLQVNMHQMAYHCGRIWIVSPRTNSLLVVNPEMIDASTEFNICEQTLHGYVPRDSLQSDDQCHFNSLLWSNGYLFVAAHNFTGPSFIKCYDGTTLKEIRQFTQAGFSIHGLAFFHDELFWLSTRTYEVRSDRGYMHLLSRQGYARGFSMTSEYFVVAISEALSRGDRHGGDSWIQLIDRQKSAMVAEFYLPDTGSVNDLRLLDEYDYAHCLTPFWN